MKDKKIYKFNSDIKQLLKLMINSIYSNKEIFLRELISNSSDAIDKMRFNLISNSDIYNKIKIDSDYCIKILLNKNEKNITISDNGIGMSFNEIIDNLGIIAKSGVKKFLDNIDLKNGKKTDVNIIGQFGVGFYSVFMVSNKVKVYSRSLFENDKNKSVLWECDGSDEYNVSYIKKDNIGTDVVLFIKDNCLEFLNNLKIKNLITKYSNHIKFPIKFCEFDKRKNIFIWNKINKSDTLWVKNKSEISDKEYINFYLSITNNLGKPLIWTHNNVEGKQNYICLLYVPDTSPWNIWNRDDFKNGVKLYIKRVFIMDDNKKLLPYYLRFIQGIIDTNDLNLNISREILQDDIVIKNIRNSITKKILKMLKILSYNKDKYICFWKNFGSILKEGFAEDKINIYDITCLLRFNSTKSDNCNIYCSLEEYINRMKPGQDKIFYLTSDNFSIAKNSPHLEYYRKMEIEVLYLYDKIDEWMMTYLVDFKGIKFFLISKEDNDNKLIKLNKSNIIEKNYDNLIKKMKEVLGNFIKDIKISDKLDKFPVVLKTDSSEMSTQMSKLLISIGKDVPKIKYLFEININHMLIKYINNINDYSLFSKWVKYLYYQALLIESGSLENPVDFINNINDLLLGFLIR